MNFKLPNLQKLVCSDKTVADDDAKKLIHVHDGFAFIFNNVFAAVDLREYVKLECSLDDIEDIQSLDKILEFLNGKAFPKSFWSEMVTECDCIRTYDGLEITKDHFKKILVYDEMVSSESNFQPIIQNINRETESVDHISFKGKHLTSIVDVFKKEFSSDSMIFEFSGKHNVIKFVGRSKN